MAGIRIAPYGKYRKLISDLGRIEKHLTGNRTDRALQLLAESARGFIVSGIMNQRPEWKPLTEMTKTIKGHDKILFDTGEFVGSVVTWKEGARWYAGIPEGATNSRGADLNMIGEVQEHGEVIKVTDAMRKFFIANGFPLKSDTLFIVVPPRPWFEPATEELDQHADEVLEPLADEMLKRLG